MLALLYRQLQPSFKCASSKVGWSLTYLLALLSAWRTAPAPVCSASSGAAASLPPTDLSAWAPQPERGHEGVALAPHLKQEWPNGAMKCDICEGYFSGWRGY